MVVGISASPGLMGVQHSIVDDGEGVLTEDQDDVIFSTGAIGKSLILSFLYSGIFDIGV